MPIKLVCFDLDGTIIENIEYIWQVLHDHFQVDPVRRDKAKDDFFSGRITYDEWAYHDVNMWKEKGATKEEILKALSHMKMVKGARETLLELKKRGIKLAVISGSINIALEAVLPDYEEIFDEIYLTKLVFDEKGNLQSCIPTKYDYEHKATALREMAEKEGIDIKDTMFIGDHDNDVEIAKTAGVAVAFNSKSDELIEVSDVVTNDLKEILEYL